VRVPTNVIVKILDYHGMVTICRNGNPVDLFRAIVKTSPKEGLGNIAKILPAKTQDSLL